MYEFFRSELNFFELKNKMYEFFGREKNKFSKSQKYPLFSGPHAKRVRDRLNSASTTHFPKEKNEKSFFLQEKNI